MTTTTDTTAEATATSSPRVTVTFERIGRNRAPGTLTFPLDLDPTSHGGLDAIAAAVHGFAGRFLASSDYVVGVSPKGTGSIEAGRFGAFTWEVAS